MNPNERITDLVDDDDKPGDIFRLNVAYLRGRTDVAMENSRRLTEAAMREPVGWSILPWRWKWF